MGLKFERLYTTEEAHPYDTVEWGTFDVSVGDFHQEGVEFPIFWSERARQIVASKYFYGYKDNRENSLKQVINRVVGAIEAWGMKDKYFCIDGDSSAFREELTYILLYQIASFNSPVWFNIGNPDLAQQASACYINSVGDTMPEILDLAKTEGMIFKGGSGAGVNLSGLRAEGEPLSGGGTASGPISFMKGWDAFAGVIKSGGVTRRAAKMIILDADHPDIHKFIQCKVLEEEKAHVLIDAGYDGGIDGEAYGSIFFQNANHSIRVTDEFMECITEPYGPYYLNYRVTPEELRSEPIEGNAELILVEAAQSAWRCGDPGIMFGDRMEEWNTCKNTGEIVATNPCGEYIWHNDTSCNLASINLREIDLKDQSVSELSHVVEIMITAMDILCGNADYPTEKIKTETLRYRTLGLGYSNLGAWIMSSGIPYDSTTGRLMAGWVTSWMTGSAYLQSARIAKVLGSFPAWEENEECMEDVLREHQDYIPQEDFPAIELWDQAISESSVNGFRNAQVTVLAPTGTISFMMDCETTGIEPLFAMETIKHLVGGGTLETSVPQCAIDGGYVPGMEKADAFATAIGHNQIDSSGHLKMVSAVQPFLSGGVSKTINLPNSATAEDIYQIYLEAWYLCLKNVSVYRDGSKRSQPLQSKESAMEITHITHPTPARVKMPMERESVTHSFNIGGHKGYITVGLYEDGTPGEIFVRMAKEGSTISGLMDAFATSVSFGLQYGIPLEFLTKKLSGARYEPSGYTGNPEVPYAKSITDYIFKWLEHRFVVSDFVPPVVDSNPQHSIAEETDSSAPFCPKCNEQMVPTGPCHTCPECGEVSGGC